MYETNLFGPEAARNEFTDLVASQAGPDLEPEGFWGTLTFVLLTIAVDC